MITSRPFLPIVYRNRLSPRRSRGVALTRRMTTYAFDRAKAALDSSAILPSLVVFDLDYTLWPYWCETMSPKDSPTLFPEAMGIVDAIREKNIKTAIASRTPTPKTAEIFLDKLDMKRRFDDIQLIPASSPWDQDTAQKDTAHFPNIQKATNIPYHQMIFFDDELRNIQRVKKLGVTSVFVDPANGVNLEAFELGLKQFQKRC